MTDPITPLGRDARQDIEDVLIRYATGIDRRDWSLFRTCFTNDCDVDYGVIGAWQSADAITAWMRDTHEPCGHTLHRISNVAVAPAADGTTSRVTATSYVVALIMDAANRVGTRATGSYDDDVVRTADGWRITRRRFTLALLEAGIEGVDLGDG